jgi:hypothetical protein
VRTTPWPAATWCEAGSSWTALRRLERAKADQDEALREWIATPEAPGTSLNLP